MSHVTVGMDQEGLFGSRYSEETPFLKNQSQKGCIYMVKVLAHFQLQEGVLPQVETLAKELVDTTRQEEGCIQYELLQAAEDALYLVMQEAWASQEALDTHSASEHFGRIVPQIAALCTEPPKVEQYTQLV